jgi:hypothetical protein
MEYDSVVSSVISAFQKRAEIGQVKYGKTLDRNDLTFLQWIQHAQEELMDGILYLEKMKKLMSFSEVSSSTGSGELSSSTQARPCQT